MSKNVAVFVDVANIFYAAKAAGVDIDYVTLLKSAVSGRDFVRAYAYTGLDPDNEGIPIVTSAMDLLGLLTLVGVVGLTGIG